jgi:predicted lipoprotein with Yx(FWY)xxD motif
MRTRRRLLTATIALVTVPLAVAAAASAATAAPAAATMHARTTAASAASASGATVITTEKTKNFGTVLVTGTGESLYTFSGDNLPFNANQGPQLACTALNTAGPVPCTTAWPPLVASSVTAKGGVVQKDLGSVTRNGVTQVTYFGKPLYGFINDTTKNAVNGEDIAAFDGTWFLDRTNGVSAVTTPTLTTEVSPTGVIMASPVADGTRSLYILTADSENASACNAAGGCDALWPPLLTNKGAVAGSGATRGLIGTIKRADGNFQVTYGGHPVYFFALDLAAGAANGLTNGEHILDPAPVDGVWTTQEPNSTPAPGTATIQSEASGSTNILADAGAVNGVTATLYAFSRDTATTTACGGVCAQIWVPVLTDTAAAAAGMADGTMLGTVQRALGVFQVTYNGHPLYYFAKALDSGTEGAGIKVFGGVFNVVNIDGSVG